MNTFQRIKLVAAREFFVTVSSKGFLFGVLVMPFIMMVMIALIPKLMAQRGGEMQVQVSLIDQSSTMAAALRSELAPEAIRARRDAGRREAEQQLGAAGQQATDLAESFVIPTFAINELASDSAVDVQKKWVTEELSTPGVRRALVVVPADAVVRPAGGSYSSYQLFAPRNLPEDAEGVLHTAVRQAMIGERLRSTGVDPEVVRAATTIARTRTVVVADGGREQGAQGLNRALPFIMGALLFMGVMIGGQALMTSTVEEKSSRVVEVLLAAVSPLELMWGKLIGHLGVGLISMGVYVVLGVLALLQFSLFGLIDPMLILYLFLFFLVAYLVFGALMLAVGAAVNQIADAQSLMGPIMLLMIIPYVLAPVIGRAPDSAVAVAASFIPPVNCFAMLARLASSSPPPAWQVVLSLLAGVVGAAIAVWFAAKIFRVGLLMHGKPPNFGTLVKWARMG
jgi:ABC-2 type transport system permease protein